MRIQATSKRRMSPRLPPSPADSTRSPTCAKDVTPAPIIDLSDALEKETFSKVETNSHPYLDATISDRSAFSCDDISENDTSNFRPPQWLKQDLSAPDTNVSRPVRKNDFEDGISKLTHSDDDSFSERSSTPSLHDGPSSTLHDQITLNFFSERDPLGSPWEAKAERSPPPSEERKKEERESPAVLEKNVGPLLQQKTALVLGSFGGDLGLYRVQVSADFSTLSWSQPGDPPKSIDVREIHSISHGRGITFFVNFGGEKMQVSCEDAAQYEKIYKAFDSLIKLGQLGGGTNSKIQISKVSSTFAQLRVQAISSWKTLLYFHLPRAEVISSLPKDRKAQLLTSLRSSDPPPDSSELQMFCDQLKGFRKILGFFFMNCFAVSGMSSEVDIQYGREALSEFFHTMGGTADLFREDIENSLKIFRNYESILSTLLSVEGKLEEEEESGESSKKKKHHGILRRLKTRTKVKAAENQSVLEQKGLVLEKKAANEVFCDLLWAKELSTFLHGHYDDISGIIVGKSPCSDLLNEVSCLKTMALLIREQNRFRLEKKEEEYKLMKGYATVMMLANATNPKGKFRFRNVEANCVSGKDVVGWFLDNKISITKEEAVLKGGMLLKYGFLSSLENPTETDLRAESDVLYRFVDAADHHGEVDAMRPVSPLPGRPSLKSVHSTRSLRSSHSTRASKTAETLSIHTLAPPSPYRLSASSQITMPNPIAQQSRILSSPASHLTPLTCLNPNIAQFPDRLQLIQRIVDWYRLLEGQKDAEQAKTFVISEVMELSRILNAEEMLERVWEGQNLNIGDVIMGVVKSGKEEEKVVFCRFHQGRPGGMSVFTHYRESKENMATLSWKQAAPLPAKWKHLLREGTRESLAKLVEPSDKPGPSI